MQETLKPTPQSLLRDNVTGLLVLESWEAKDRGGQHRTLHHQGEPFRSCWNLLWGLTSQLRSSEETDASNSPQ